MGLGVLDKIKFTYEKLKFRLIFFGIHFIKPSRLNGSITSEQIH